MGVMRFHTHGTSGRKGRGRVAACDREGQWKVARAEHCNRSYGPQKRADVRLGERLALRIGVVYTGIHPGTLFDKTSEQLKLVARAGCFALNASRRESCFLRRPSSQSLAQDFYV